MRELLTLEQAERLTNEAHSQLVADLVRNGNRLSDLHKQALYDLVKEMTAFVTGETEGRRAFALGTGCGKTSAIIAWITALYRLGHREIAVSVSASKVEALCSLKRDLLSRGIPEELIGLKHSVRSDREEILPSTGNDDRLFQLVTHARVHGGNDIPLFTEHKGKRRALMIYDETLFKAKPESISERSLRMQVASLKEEIRGQKREPDYQPLFAFLDQSTKIISDALEELNANTSCDPVLCLPVLDEIKLDGFLYLLGNSPLRESIRRFLQMVHLPLRLIQTNQGDGMVQYQVSVPPELENILILDASYPIRELEKLDSSIKDCSPGYIREVKRFDNVAVNQMNHPSGRDKTEENFRKQRPSDRTMSKEAIKVVKEIPDEKSILFFTFKARAGGVNIRETLLRDMADAGIDINAVNAEGKKRINILTWGSETSLNCYSHCDVIILVGLLHLPELEVAAQMIGQQDCLRADASKSMIAKAVASEIAHSVYQAISRGRCRIVDNGQAMPTEVYLFHNESSLKEALQEVMPGLSWREWIPTYTNSEIKLGKVDVLAMQIKAYLDRLPSTRHEVATREIREHLSIDKPSDSLKKATIRAIDKVCRTGLWSRKGHSLVRSYV